MGSGRRAPSAGRWSAALAGVGGLALLAPRVSESIGTGDRAEFVIVAYTLGIPHPTGYPVYAWLGKLFSLLPLGSAPARIGMLSATCAAAALALTAWLVAESLRRAGTRGPLAGAAALLAALLLAGVPVFHEQALVPEVYATKALFAVGILICVLRYALGGRTGFLYGGSLLLGLGLGVHLSLLSLGFPILLALAVRRPSPGVLARAVGSGALGASCLFTLYLRAGMEPAYLHPQAHFTELLRWTGTDNGLYNWAWFVTGGRWHGHTVEGLPAVGAKLLALARALAESPGPAALGLVALALAVGLRDPRPALRLPVALLGLSVLGELVYFASYAPSELAMVLPLFLSLAALAGIGFGLLGSGLLALRRRLALSAPTLAAALLGVAVVVALPALAVRFPDRSGDDATARLLEEMAAGLPDGSVVEGLYWSYSRPLLYYELVEERAFPFRFDELDAATVARGRGFALGDAAAQGLRERGYRTEPHHGTPGAPPLFRVLPPAPP